MDQIASNFAPRKGAAHDASSTSIGHQSANTELMQIQRFLNLIGAGGDAGPMPVAGRASPGKLLQPVKAPSGEQPSAEQRPSSVIEHPVEFACVAAKLYAEVLLRMKAVT